MTRDEELFAMEAPEFSVRAVMNAPEDFRHWARWFAALRAYLFDELELGVGEWICEQCGADKWVFCFREADAAKAVQFKLRWAA